MSTLATTNLKNASSGSNNIVLNTDGTTTITAPSNIIKSGTAVASTSGVAIDFTGIPSWAKRVTVMFNGVSTSGTSIVQLQLGTSGGFVTSGYLGSVDTSAAGVAGVAFATGLALTRSGGQSAAILHYGMASFANISGNTWMGTQTNGSSANQVSYAGCSIALSGVLTQLRITTVNGTDTFDAGSINILWEG